MKKKVLLLLPDAYIHKIDVLGFRMSLREAPLTATTLAALIPSELNVDVTIVDESVQKVPKHQHFDLVGISCLTGTAYRAYEWAQTFRKMGATVILGGMHVTLCPEEALQHADAILTGFAEKMWPELLRDFEKGTLKRQYDGGEGCLSALPEPRRDLQKSGGYTMPNTVFATRGCRYQCSFCAITAARIQWNTRPVSAVVDEVRNLRGKRFTFNDVNLLSDRDYALELLVELASLGKKWGGLATVGTAEDIEMLEALNKAGCQYLLCGFESIAEDSLAGIRKSFNPIQKYREYMQAFHAHGISIQGCFIFGLDEDRKDVFEKTVAAVDDLGIDIPRYAINTPYPGTALFAQLKKERRLLHENWSYYDTQHVVFKPKHMSAQELDDGFRYALKKTFSPRSIRRRILKSPHPIVSGVGNFVYWKYHMKLRHATNRMFVT